MVDLGYGIGVVDIDGDSRIGFTTVHGYQFNKYLFVGAGLGLNYFLNDRYVYYYKENMGTIGVPVFADARGTLPLKDNVALFFDFRLGYSFVDYVTGVYMSPSVGVRVGRKYGVTFSLGYEYQGCDTHVYFDPDALWKYYSSSGNAGAITFRLGFDW